MSRLSSSAAGGGSSTSSLLVNNTVSGTVYTGPVLADGPIAYYRLGETSGTSAADSSSGGIGAATYLPIAQLGQTGAIADGNRAAGNVGTNFAIVTSTVTPTTTHFSCAASDALRFSTVSPQTILYTNRQFGGTVGATTNVSSVVSNGTDYTVTVSPALPGALVAGDAVRYAGPLAQKGSLASRPAGTSSRTLECWFQTTCPAPQMLVSYGTGGGTTDFHTFGLLLMGPQELRCDIQNAWRIAALGQRVDDGRWHHAAATFNGTNCTLYMDGVQVGSSGPLQDDAGSSQTAAVGSSGQTLYLGCHLNGVDQPLWGTLDEVAIYASALSATRIGVHYAAGPLASSGYFAHLQNASVDAFVVDNLGNVSVGGSLTLLAPAVWLGDTGRVGDTSVQTPPEHPALYVKIAVPTSVAPGGFVYLPAFY
jgi:hypothetical protein